MCPVSSHRLSMDVVGFVRQMDLQELQRGAMKLLEENEQVGDGLAAAQAQTAQHAQALAALVSRLEAAETDTSAKAALAEAATVECDMWRTRYTEASLAAEEGSVSTKAALAAQAESSRSAEHLSSELQRALDEAARARQRADELQEQLMSEQREWHARERDDHARHATRLAEAEAGIGLLEKQLAAANAEVADAEKEQVQLRTHLREESELLRQAREQQQRTEDARSADSGRWTERAEQALAASHAAQEAQVAAQQKVVAANARAATLEQTLTSEQHAARQLAADVERERARATETAQRLHELESELNEARAQQLKLSAAAGEGRREAATQARAQAAEAESLRVQLSEEGAVRAAAEARARAATKAMESAEHELLTATKMASFPETQKQISRKSSTEGGDDVLEGLSALQQQRRQQQHLADEVAKLRDTLAIERIARRQAEATSAQAVASTEALKSQLQAQHHMHKRGEAHRHRVGSDIVGRSEFEQLVQDWKLANTLLERLQAECKRRAASEAALRQQIMSERESKQRSSRDKAVQAIAMSTSQHVQTQAMRGRTQDTNVTPTPYQSSSAIPKQHLLRNVAGAEFQTSAADSATGTVVGPWRRGVQIGVGSAAVLLAANHLNRWNAAGPAFT
jgi:hypothetical protein